MKNFQIVIQIYDKFIILARSFNQSNYLKQRFHISENEAEKELDKVQEELDRMVEEMYMRNCNKME